MLTEITKKSYFMTELSIRWYLSFRGAAIYKLSMVVDHKLILSQVDNDEWWYLKTHANVIQPIFVLLACCTRFVFVVLYLYLICAVFVLYLVSIGPNNSSEETRAAIRLIICDSKIAWLMWSEIGLCQINYARFAWPRYNRVRDRHEYQMKMWLL